MELRAALEFPSLDESKVERLAELAATIDGSRPGECEFEVSEFNGLAGTEVEFTEFQGVFGRAGYETWVRNVLCAPFAEKNLDLSHDETLELISRLCGTSGTPNERFFWTKVLETSLDPKIADLIYWPGKYFGDGDDSREMSPCEILAVALKRKNAQRAPARSSTRASLSQLPPKPSDIRAKMVGLAFVAIGATVFAVCVAQPAYQADAGFAVPNLLRSVSLSVMFIFLGAVFLVFGVRAADILPSNSTPLRWYHFLGCATMVAIIVTTWLLLRLYLKSHGVELPEEFD